MRTLGCISFRPIDVGFDLKMTRTAIVPDSIPATAKVLYIDQYGLQAEFTGRRARILDVLQQAGYQLARPGAKSERRD
jgi:hypothetical protein